MSFLFSFSSEILHFVSQGGDFPDLFEDQMSSAGAAQSGSAVNTPRPALRTPQTSQTPLTPTPLTPTPPVYQSTNVSLASQTLSPQSLPLTPPLTPAQTSSPTVSTGPQQVTRSPPLLQPRPQVVQPIQPQPQQTMQPTIQVSTVWHHFNTSILHLR